MRIYDHKLFIHAIHRIFSTRLVFDTEDYLGCVRQSCWCWGVGGYWGRTKWPSSLYERSGPTRCGIEEGDAHRVNEREGLGREHLDGRYTGCHGL